MKDEQTRYNERQINKKIRRRRLEYQPIPGWPCCAGGYLQAPINCQEYAQCFGSLAVCRSTFYHDVEGSRRQKTRYEAIEGRRWYGRDDGLRKAGSKDAICMD
ncbi:hypothetical protein TNCV_4592381 [Trichonephila clavipes]|nr:hypothetical protein TNCV_4592381 [Trichonephila clavipes]